MIRRPQPQPPAPAPCPSSPRRIVSCRLLHAEQRESSGIGKIIDIEKIKFEIGDIDIDIDYEDFGDDCDDYGDDNDDYDDFDDDLTTSSNTRS